MLECKMVCFITSELFTGSISGKGWGLRLLAIEDLIM